MINDRKERGTQLRHQQPPSQPVSRNRWKNHMPHLLHHVPEEIRAYDLVPIRTYNMRQLSWGHHQESSIDAVEPCSVPVVSQKDRASAADEWGVQGIREVAWIDWGAAVCDGCSGGVTEAEEQQDYDNGLWDQEEEPGDHGDDEKDEERRVGEGQTARIKYAAQKNSLRTYTIPKTPP